MIDYLTLMLANLTVGLVVMAWFLLGSINSEDSKSWAPAFGVMGLIATVTGFAMTSVQPVREGFR